MTKEEAEAKYKEYLDGHINNVNEALGVISQLGIPFVDEHLEELKDICKDHDKSKWDEPEWSAYLHHFYPTNDEEAMMSEEFETACRHHIKNNKHHWDYWVDDENNLIDGIDEEEYKLYAVERCCDWLAMANQQEEAPSAWYNANKAYMIMPDYGFSLTDEIFNAIPEDIKLSYVGTRGDKDEAQELDEDLYLNRGVVQKLGKRVKKSKTSNTIEIDTQMTNHDKQLKEEVLTEITAAQIKQKSKNEDPQRIARSRKVKTTYLGMSKFGILNFKTTSQSRNGHHYQTLEFKDMKYFEDIIKTGRNITADDIKKAIKEQDINVWCTDESFTYWAWGHLAYKDDFLYIDDRVPDLKTRIQAPKINNVRLNGGSCKHVLSMLDYMNNSMVLKSVANDMNKYLAGTSEDKYSKQTDETKSQKDQVASWNWDDVEEHLGLSRLQIIRDISNSLQIVPSAGMEDIVMDFVGEALPPEEQGLKREITDKVVELVKKEGKGKKSK